LETAAAAIVIIGSIVTLEFVFALKLTGLARSVTRVPFGLFLGLHLGLFGGFFEFLQFAKRIVGLARFFGDSLLLKPDQLTLTFFFRESCGFSRGLGRAVRGALGFSRFTRLDNGATLRLTLDIGRVVWVKRRLAEEFCG
jgi:hypothetical protein